MAVVTQDPTEYPVTFSVEPRNVVPLEERSAVVTFAVDSSSYVHLIQRAAYFFDGSFFLDRDLFDDQDIPISQGRFNVIYEATANSTNIAEAELMVKVWNRDSSFFVMLTGEVLDFRQISSSYVTSHTIMNTSAMKLFDAVSVGGTEYYPYVRVAASFVPKYDKNYSISAIVVDPGSSSKFSIAPEDAYGVVSIVFDFSLLWFYDEERTLPVLSPPSSLPELGVSNGALRMAIGKAGRFNVSGTVTDGGSAVFSGILKQRYILESGLDYGQMHYLALRSDGLLGGNVQDEIIIDDNGVPIQAGNDTAVYILDAI